MNSVDQLRKLRARHALSVVVAGATTGLFYSLIVYYVEDLHMAGAMMLTLFAWYWLAILVLDVRATNLRAAIVGVKT